MHDGMNEKDWQWGGEPRDQASELLEQRIADALERAPAVRVPEDFARRVMAQVPERGAWRAGVQVPKAGWAAAVVCLVAMLVALVVLAPRASGSGLFPMAMVWVLCVQFCVVAAWVAVRGAAGER